MTSPFQNEQHEWAGTTLQPLSTAMASNTQFQAPFTASTSDDLFAPVSGGHISQPQIFVPNSIPLNDNTAYNQLPHTPTAQSSCFHAKFAHDRPPHFNTPQCIHPSHFQCMCTPVSNTTFTQAHVPSYQPFAPTFLPQQPPFYYHNHHPPSALIQYVYLPAPPPPVTIPVIPDTPVLPPAPKSLPVLTLIPILNIKSDFYAWDDGVTTLLHHLGVHGHIVDPTTAITPQRPDLSPSIRPLLSVSPLLLNSQFSIAGLRTTMSHSMFWLDVWGAWLANSCPLPESVRLTWCIKPFANTLACETSRIARCLLPLSRVFIANLTRSRILLLVGALGFLVFAQKNSLSVFVSSSPTLLTHSLRPLPSRPYVPCSQLNLSA